MTTHYNILFIRATGKARICWMKMSDIGWGRADAGESFVVPMTLPLLNNVLRALTILDFQVTFKIL